MSYRFAVFMADAISNQLDHGDVLLAGHHADILCSALGYRTMSVMLEQLRVMESLEWTTLLLEGCGSIRAQQALYDLTHYRREDWLNMSENFQRSQHVHST